MSGAVDPRGSLTIELVGSICKRRCDMAYDPNDSSSALRVLSFVLIVIGAVCLGLAWSGWNYIQWVHNHGYKAYSSTINECIGEVAIGLVSCSVGLLLWFVSKGPAK